MFKFEKNGQMENSMCMCVCVANQEGGVHILGAPVVQNDGTLTAVIELYRCGLIFNVNFPMSIKHFQLLVEDRPIISKQFEVHSNKRTKKLLAAI